MGTLYQKDQERFHLLLTEPPVRDRDFTPDGIEIPLPALPTPRLLWLELSPYRVIMTMQGNGKFSYRHLWERGVYGLSRYWSQGEDNQDNTQLHLRNFTRHLQLEGRPLPHSLRVDYELWSGQIPLGHYILSLEIQH